MTHNPDNPDTRGDTRRFAERGGLCGPVAKVVRAQHQERQ